MTHDYTGKYRGCMTLTVDKHDHHYTDYNVSITPVTSCATLRQALTARARLQGMESTLSE